MYCNNHANCSLTAADMATMNSKLKCLTNYTRYGYTCVADSVATSAYVHFNRCYNFLSVYNSFSSNAKNAIKDGYIFEFWFRMDYFGEKCNEVPPTTKKYVMYSYPHTFYYYNVSPGILLYANLKDATMNVQLKAFKQYEWNNIMIATETVNDTTKVNIYVNYSFLNPIRYTTTTDQMLYGIGICNGNCNPGNQGAASITWGSAYYRDIKVYKNISASIYTVQGIANEMYILY
jgi:hypothetical protein